jgi:hypothetical protein
LLVQIWQKWQINTSFSCHGHGYNTAEATMTLKQWTFLNLYLSGISQVVLFASFHYFSRKLLQLSTIVFHDNLGIWMRILLCFLDGEYPIRKVFLFKYVHHTNVRFAPLAFLFLLHYYPFSYLYNFSLTNYCTHIVYIFDKYLQYIVYFFMYM